MREYSVQVTLDLTVQYDDGAEPRPNDVRADVCTLIEGADFHMNGVRAWVCDVARVGRAS